MSFFMCHQGLNILSRKPIFYRRTFCLFYITKGLGLVCRFRIRKLTYILIFTEADNIDTLTMLWHTEIHGVHYLRVRYIIIKVVTQYIEDGFNSLSFIMNEQSFYIFEKECTRAFATDYLSNIKEKCTTCFFKSSTFTCQRKRLTRKSGTKDVKGIWYVLLCFLFCYIPKRHFSIVQHIGSLCLFIPFRGKYTSTAKILHSHTEASNTGKKVYKSEFRFVHRKKRHIKKFIEQIHLKCVFCNHIIFFSLAFFYITIHIFH